MINDKTVLAIIPARGGSKGLPGKNIRPICGKPLIAWSIEQSLSSICIDRTIVSTDSADIANVARKYGADVPFIRPDDLATDQASTMEVVDHAIQYLKNNDEVEYDYIVLIEPTSPLREKDDLDSMLHQLEKHSSDFDSIISIGEVTEHPSIMKRKVDFRLEPFCSELVMEARRQDNTPAYFPYGVGYIVKTDTLRSEMTFYTTRCMYYEIKRYQNYEIDDLYDFMCVEAVMKNEWDCK
jgi:CMP-N,N'-diacetyllegionaminic acid synthase